MIYLIRYQNGVAVEFKQGNILPASGFDEVSKEVYERELANL